jgi:hypothetical protein
VLRKCLVFASTVFVSINVYASSAHADAYYLVLPDPIEAGYFVQRLNYAYTQCADGTWSGSCYVPDLDTSKLGLPEETVEYIRDRIEEGDGGVILRADLTSSNLLAASEAWIGGAEWGWPEGWAVKVEQTGIRCVAAPCEDKLETRLNTNKTEYIADLDFTASTCSGEEEETALDALTPEGGGLIVLGWRTYVYGPGGNTGKARTVEQFYTRVQ